MFKTIQNLMFASIQPEVYHKKARCDLDHIRHNLKLLQHFSQEIDSFAHPKSQSQINSLSEKNEKTKNDIRQKLKCIGCNLDQMISILDYKITIISKQLSKRMEKNNGNCNPPRKPIFNKNQDEYRNQINQLEEKIFEFQKKQNLYVKQISQLKEKNFKLRQEFTNYSFDSNQRIKQLSQKLHNNTSPNLTIKRLGSNNLSPEIKNEYEINSYIGSDQHEFELKQKKNNSKNNFVKIKGFAERENLLQQSPGDYKKSKNLLDSLTSESSEYDVQGLDFRKLDFEQSSRDLKFGCFPSKQSEKTKTGSSSENKKLKFEEKSDKNRRFEFLLNNLIDDKNSNPLSNPQQISPVKRISSGISGGYQKYQQFQYNHEHDDERSVFGQNVIKRYQI